MTQLMDGLKRHARMLVGSIALMLYGALTLWLLLRVESLESELHTLQVRVGMYIASADTSVVPRAYRQSKNRLLSDAKLARTIAIGVMLRNAGAPLTQKEVDAVKQIFVMSRTACNELDDLDLRLSANFQLFNNALTLQHRNWVQDHAADIQEKENDILTRVGGREPLSHSFLSFWNGYLTSAKGEQ